MAGAFAQVSLAQSILDVTGTSPSDDCFDSLYRIQRHDLHGAFGKRLNTSYSVSSSSTKPIILLDVEGTTTPLPFVTKVLYPESMRKFTSYVTANYDALAKTEIPEAAAKCGPTIGLQKALQSGDKSKVITVFVDHLCELVAKNEKASYLKSIQGKIWRTGYESGQIKGHLFEDVAKAIQRWAVTGLADVHIYSSGSIQAQKLLFRHSSHGDLSPYLSGYHDTISAGPKFEAESYRKIQAAVGSERPIIFLTDILAEVNAATKAGVTSVLSIRPLNKTLQQKDVWETEGLIHRHCQGLAADQLLTMVSFSQLPGAVEEGSDVAWEHLQQSAIPYSDQIQGSNGQLKSFL